MRKIKKFKELNESFHTPDGDTIGVDKNHMPVSKGDVDNYMFFANLENICRMSREILDDMDRDHIDSMLTDGHDWAADHISKSKESISHVYNWLKSDR
jgi:hypothetical protein